nr:hypothetical protein [Staphylococcus hominis]
MDKNLSSLITIFGGTGDLSYRKLLPSIFNLYKKGHFKKLVIISTGLEDISDEEYRSKVKQILLSQENFEMVNLFLDNIFYFQQNVEDKTSWNKLKELSNDIDKKYCLDGNRLFYLAMNPQFFKICFFWDSSSNFWFFGFLHYIQDNFRKRYEKFNSSAENNINNSLLNSLCPISIYALLGSVAKLIL